MKIAIIILVLILNSLTLKADNLPTCNWENKNGIPCINISKTNNTSKISEAGVVKTIISKQEIENLGITNIGEILKTISGMDVYRDGPSGQKTSIFTRGSESNHTLVLLNGIAINDQSVTNGLHDFGQDFVKTIEQIEVYKGSNGAHFGPSAIAGAVNFITAINYKNSFTIGGFDGRNNNLSGNYYKLTKNGWGLNIKSSGNQSDTDSAHAAGSENDDSNNVQLNLNAEKWINDNTKFKSTLLARKTRAKYDDMSNNGEAGYVSDNVMYALQTALEKVSNNKQDSFILHYHAYDRYYDDGGYDDYYDSESIVAKAERKVDNSEKLSFGFGSEYKYDWGSFDNAGASFTSSTKGHVKDLGIFANAGYKILDKSIFSFYGRVDDHLTAGRHDTYKINYTQEIDNFKFGLTHSTGLRNPTLYELYGSNNFGYKGNTSIKPEKSKTNEIFGIFNISSNLIFKSTAYRATIFDRLKSNSSFTATENKNIDLNQEGLESELILTGENQKISLFTNFSKSKQTSGAAQQRRPDVTYGSNYFKKFLNSPIGPFNLNLNYKFTGKHWDYKGGAVKVKSTNIVNMTAAKSLYGNTFNFSISNLLNERYERPITYRQDGRQFRLGFSRNF